MLNQQQVQALEMIGEFLQPDNPDKAFILKGSVGTGKTTLMNAVAGMLSDNFEQVIIAAPTNKAAKSSN